MTTYYVDGDTGNDANPGSEASPFKTLNALDVMNTWDAAYLAGLILSHDNQAARITFIAKSNLTIAAWPGRSPPRVRGYKIITSDWTDNEDGTFDTTIPTGLPLTGLVYNWETSINANGQHYGHCRRYTNKAAVQAAASGAKGKFAYDSGTGVVTGYFGGADPNTAEVAFVAASATEAAIKIVGGTGGNTVGDIDFGCYPIHSGQFGWAVLVQGSTGNAINSCVAHDMGAHSFGTLAGAGNTSDIAIRNCRCVGLSPTGTHNVHNGLDSEGTRGGCVVENPVVVVGRWLGIDGLVLDGRGDTVAAMDANSQIPVYAHTDTGTTIPIGGVRVTNVDFNYAESGGAPFYIENCVMPGSADELDPTKFPMWVDRGRVYGVGLGAMNWARAGGSKAIAVSRVAFTHSKALSAGESPCAMQSSGTYSLFITWLFCTHSFNLGMPLAGDSAFCHLLGAFTGGTQRMNFVHNTFYDRSTQAESTVRGMLHNNGEAVKYATFIGCVKSFKTPSSLKANQWNNAQSAANHGEDDNLYFGVADDSDGRYSFASYPTFGNAADYIGAGKVDTGGVLGRNNLTVQPIANETTLELTTEAMSLKRLTSTIAAATAIGGINGVPFVGTYGAWQRVDGSRRRPPRILRAIGRHNELIRRGGR